MTYFSSLQFGGTAFYGDPFGPIIDTITDFGWSLLPQFPGSVGPSKGGGYTPPQPYIPTGPLPSVPGIPVEEDYGYAGETSGVYPVYPGPFPTGGPYVPTETVIVGEVSTEVERYETGDFPAGSIFAPGRAWGVDEHLDVVPRQEPPTMSVWGDIFSGAIDIWQGQPVGGGDINYTMPFNPLGTGAGTQRPGGAAALPPSAAPVLSNGTADCGNRRYVTLDRQTGKITCKRRRRRRLLTNRDLADLASLKTITGGGAALNAAVIRAVR